jgi:hypothetical protein
MNVGFPKAQDLVTALGKVGIASLIPVRVGLLNRMQIALIDGGVAMPEITVPLNNQTLIWAERVNNKLAADYLLLKEVDADAFKNGAPSSFELIRFFVGGKSQNTVDALHVKPIVAASMTAILDCSFESPTRHIERIAARFATLDDTAAASIDRVLSRYLFGLCGILPSVRAIKRTEGNSAATARHKLFATVAAYVSTTGIATGGIVRAWQERLTAFLAWLRCAGNVFHALIIPWSVAKCN